MNLEPESVGLIREFFKEREFLDRAENHERNQWVDVVIPVLHSNELWRENLLSFFREIPINRIILGDAGCIDQTISIASDFPRIDVVNHSHISTLGASIADLITRVKTPKFVYLQSDVFLPAGWFDEMSRKSEEFAWVGSPMQVVTMLDYRVDYSGRRPLAGAQMGNSSLFKNLHEFIDDDYVYRQEDFVLEEYVKRLGHHTGNSLDTFHFHQVMRRKTNGMKMNVQSISINLSELESEKSRVKNTQLYGLMKYCDSHLLDVRSAAYAAFQEQRSYRFRDFMMSLKFAHRHNPKWKFLLLRFWLKAIIEELVQFFAKASIKITNTILRLQ